MTLWLDFRFDPLASSDPRIEANRQLCHFDVFLCQNGLIL